MDYDLVTLIDVLKVQKRPMTFWLEKAFPNQINSTDDKIAFDRVNEDYRRLAPFVAPNVKGKVMAEEGYDTISFKPAYVKPKHVIDPDDVIVRRPGEAIGGSLTPQQRRDAKVAEILDRHKSMHVMTQEWMAARAIIDASVTIVGDGYPAVTVDFRRDPSLSIALAGGARWSQGTATPLADIYNARAKCNELCGAVVRDVIFGKAALDYFTGFQAVKDLLKTDVRNSQTELSALADGFGDSIEYIGELRGQAGQGAVRIWLYTGQFKDEAGVLQLMLDTNTVVGADFNMVQGFRCFGAIKDGKAGFQALEMFPKVWEEEDPWQELLMTQSAPIMVPKQPNATFKIRVHV